MQVESFQYDNKTVRNFAIATIIWGVVGMTVGLWVALQLVYPTILNLQPYFNFGRIRPLHTNAVIFAFVENVFDSLNQNKMKRYTNVPSVENQFKKALGLTQVKIPLFLQYFKGFKKLIFYFILF